MKSIKKEGMKMEKNILYASSGIKYVLEYLKRNLGYKHRNVRPINQGRYYIVYGEPNTAIVFKRDWFYKFKEICGGEGIGESINVEDLKEMIKSEVKIIYILHSSGQIYKIDIMDYLLNSISWRNKENKEVRSISVHLLERVNKEEVSI